MSESAALRFRVATHEDLPAIVALLADDELGQAREDPALPLDEAYERAFAAIDADDRNELVVAERAGVVVGTLQLTYLPSISHHGAERAQLEAVRVAGAERASGVGRAMVGWGLERARARGCRVAQLTTDVRRPDAHRFYASLGFEATHVGLKLAL